MSSGTTDSRLGTSRSQGSPHERIGAFSRTEPKNEKQYIFCTMISQKPGVSLTGRQSGQLPTQVWQNVNAAAAVLHWLVKYGIGLKVSAILGFGFGISPKPK